MILERGVLLNNRYRIVEVLGQGGMGSVYRAVDENLGVEVAAKDNLFTTEEYARQFRREAIILANLRHPNLPRVTDHFVITGQGQYLVMDYIEGEDLRQRMERSGVVPEEEIITIGAAVCDALTYLASRNPPIIHRDIKPGNVKITPQGQIFLVDFGLAKTLHGSQATTTGARAMTPGFSPPEQYGTARTDHRTDIFSLGATLYAALTGCTPEDALARAMDQAELTPIRTHNSRISRKMETAIAKALEVRPDDRYQSGEEFKQALLGTSLSSRRREGDYVITPPPMEEKEIPPEEGVASEADMKQPLLPEKRLSPLSPSGAPLGAREASRPRPQLRKRGGARGCWISFLMAGLLVVAAGAGIYFYAPSLPSQVIAQIWPLIFSPMATATRVGTVQVSPTPSTAADTPNYTEIVLATDTISPTSTPTHEPTQVPTPTITPTPQPTLVGGSGRIAFASDMTGAPQIYVINADGTGLQQITDMSEGACQPDWSPDAQRLVFISPCDSNRSDYIYPVSAMYIINLDGTGLLPLPTLSGGDFDPAWSPDGKKIAFTSLRNSSRSQIYILELDTNKVEVISEKYSYDQQPAWSKDGKEIIFSTNRRGAQHIWVMDADGKNARQFSFSQSMMEFRPFWSPDEKTVIFTQVVKIGGIPWVAIVPYTFDNYTEYRIGQGPMPMREAKYSPDGLWIAFEGWTASRGHDIYIIAANGAARQQVTTNPAFDFDPAWSPLP